MAGNKLKVTGIFVIVLIIALVIMFLIFRPIIIVKPGFAAVVENTLTGMEKRVLRPGTHLLIPFVENGVVYNVKVQTYTISGSSSEGEKSGDDAIDVLTADGQKAWIDLTLEYRYDTNNLYKFHETIDRSTFRENILRPSIRSVVRNLVSKYSVIELYSSRISDIAVSLGVSPASLQGKLVGRDALEQDIFTKMQEDMDRRYVIVENVRIRNIRFSDEYQQAIEKKQVAQQEAERMNYVLEKTRKEKEAAIIEAEGKAEAIRLVGDTLSNNPRVIDYEYVQKIAPGIKAIVTDNRAIVNFSDILKESKQ